MNPQIQFVDYLVLTLYLLGIVGLGLYAGLRQKRDRHAASGYFLAAHSLTWPEIGLALFATNISCVHLVSLAQAGYDQGLLMGNFEWMAGFTLVLLALVFVPFYMRSKVTTLPDFLERRYGRECRDWLAVLSIIAAIICHIAFPLVTGWTILHSIFGIEEWTCLGLICGLTALYTVTGGLAAVVVTEMVQAIVLVIGATIISLLAWSQAGGWHGLETTLQAHGELGKLQLLRPAQTEPDFPWYAIFLGYPVLGIWYWCADQTMVQRVLGAKDENHARTGALFCAMIKVLPVFIFVLPGLLFYVIVQQGKIPGLAVANSKEVYGLMIAHLLPHGLFGVMAAALIAATMGNLASAANSIATLFSYDIWARFRPSASETQLVLVGRLAALASFAIGIGLVPLLDLYGSIFAGINDIIAHVAPPITCVFLLGVFWPAASAASARWTMWIGSGVGVLVYTLKTLHTWKPGVMTSVPAFIYQTPFMLMTFFLLVFCVVLQVALTVASPKQPGEDASALHLVHPLDCLRAPGWPGLANYRVLAAITVFAFLCLYILFA
jgi:SSS family solute:Na+ symporter